MKYTRNRKSSWTPDLYTTLQIVHFIERVFFLVLTINILICLNVNHWDMLLKIYRLNYFNLEHM